MVDVPRDKSENRSADGKLGFFIGVVSLVFSCLMLLNIGETARLGLSTRMIIEQHGTAIVLGLTSMFTSSFLITLTIEHVFKGKIGRIFQLVANLCAGSVLVYLAWSGFSIVSRVSG